MTRETDAVPPLTLRKYIMEYNTTRSKLIIPEYGRNVQEMVNHCISLEDKDKRTRLAKLIVSVMAQLNPQIRDLTDYKQKLWDHLHVIADFKLDVDAPYPIPSPESIAAKPDPIAYKDSRINYRHYGRNIEQMIDVVAKMEDGPEKEDLTRDIANYLKKSYLTWNRDSVTDEAISDHLKQMSKGLLTIPEDMVFEQTADILAAKPKKKSKQRSNRNYQGKQYPRKRFNN